VFDKTGTLTEDGLSVLGFRPTEKVERREQAGALAAVYREFMTQVEKLRKYNWWQ
jgi:cation-transporting P-type ATPase 13A2